MKKNVHFYFACAATLIAYKFIFDESAIFGHAEKETAQTITPTKSQREFKLPAEDSSHLNEPQSEANQNLRTVHTTEPSSTFNIAEDRDEKMLLDLATKKPNLAAQIALDAPADLRLKYLGIVIKTWGEHDFDAAWKWSEHAGENTFHIRKILIATLSAREPEKIASLTKQWSASQPLQASDIYDLAIFSLAETEKFDLAAQLAEKTPLADDDRASVLRSITNDWADRNPDEAAEWALQKDGETHAIALTAVVDRWINNSPIHAAEFVKQLPESNQKSELMQEVFSRWLAIDEVGAKAWSAANGYLSASDTDSL